MYKEIYKVVCRRKDNRRVSSGYYDASLNGMENRILEYPKNTTVFPKPGCGLLCAFDSFSNAKSFIDTAFTGSSNFEIWEGLTSDYCIEEGQTKWKTEIRDKTTEVDKEQNLVRFVLILTPSFEIFSDKVFYKYNVYGTLEEQRSICPSSSLGTVLCKDIRLVKRVF